MASILLGLFAITLQAISTVAIDDHYISNGTCYYKTGAEADESYAPIGNIIYGHIYCCALGDKINSNHACMNESIEYTYLAGCTDPTYEHDSCPYKGNYSDYQWVGLSLCDGDGWAGCPNDESATPRISPESEGCICDPDADEILFNRGSGLDAVGHMPEIQGETISYQAGMKPKSFSSYPTDLANSVTSSSKTLAPPTTRVSTFSGGSATTVDSQSSASSDPSQTPASTSTSTATPTAISVASEGLSHGAVAGITVGVCMAGVLVAIGAFALWRYRKSQQAPQSTPNEYLKSSLSTPHNDSAVLGFTETDSRSPTLTETKSELPGSPVTTASKRESFSSQSLPPSPMSKEQAYRPFRYQPANEMHNIQEMPNQERPQWAQTVVPSPVSTRYPAGALPPRPENIHELPG